MEVNKIQADGGLEIESLRLLRTIWNRFWLVALCSVLGAVTAFLLSLFVITPQYESSALFYVNNGSLSVGGSTISISSADISASKSLVDSYIVILDTRETYTEILEKAQVDLPRKTLKGMISAAPVNDTEIFRVSVTDTDPYRAKRLADAVAEVLPSRISGIIEGTSAIVVSTPEQATVPCVPNYKVNILTGFIIGLLLSLAAVTAYEILDITIRTEETVAQCCSHPVLTAVPDLRTGILSGGYYSYGSKTYSNVIAGTAQQPLLVGSDVSFAAAEAYKLLRTRLQFYFPEDRCYIIGVSSAMAGEGKSLSAANLAYSLSQLGKRVLLVDCDMRCPSVHTKLPVRKSPGLSELLSNQNGWEEVVQPCGLHDSADPSQDAFQVIASGRNPPNPNELLNAPTMTELLLQLRQRYDYVVLDFPPVGEVSEALAIAKHTDGMLLVVRQGYCNRNVLTAAVRQFEYMNAKTLGIVYNCAGERTGSYGYSKSYRKAYVQSRYESSYVRSKNKSRRKKPTDQKK